MKDKDILKKVIEDNLLNKEEIRRKVLEEGHKEYEKSRRLNFNFNINRGMVAVTSSIFIIFVIMINSNYAFAQVMYQIPIISGIAKVLTLKDYYILSDSNNTHVKIPYIADTGNTELENKMNKKIKETIENLAFEAQKYADEYKKDFLASGNEEKDFKQITIDFNYEVKCSNEKVLSFIIKKTEDVNGEDVTFYMYNMALDSGNDITLQSVFGDNYKEIINKEIDRQVKEKAKKDENLLSYYNEFYVSKGISVDENNNFYINEKGNVVIVFYKYEIAPEYAGIQEFEIVK